MPDSGRRGLRPGAPLPARSDTRPHDPAPRPRGGRCAPAERAPLHAQAAPPECAHAAPAHPPSSTHSPPPAAPVHVGIARCRVRRSAAPSLRIRRAGRMAGRSRPATASHPSDRAPRSRDRAPPERGTRVAAPGPGRPRESSRARCRPDWPAVPLRRTDCRRSAHGHHGRSNPGAPRAWRPPLRREAPAATGEPRLAAGFPAPTKADGRDRFRRRGR